MHGTTRREALSHGELWMLLRCARHHLWRLNQRNASPHLETGSHRCLRQLLRVAVLLQSTANASLVDSQRRGVRACEVEVHRESEAASSASIRRRRSCMALAMSAAA